MIQRGGMTNESLQKSGLKVFGSQMNGCGGAGILL